MDETKIRWSAFEYEEKKRSADWFWALGVVVMASSAASLIYGNYFFAMLLVLGGVLLGFFAIKKPGMISYELGEKGLKVKDRIFLYENIKSFWVQPGEKPTLFIKSERIFMPILSIPIEQSLAGRIRDFMLAGDVPEEEMKEQPAEKIMESLGF